MGVRLGVGESWTPLVQQSCIVSVLLVFSCMLRTCNADATEDVYQTTDLDALQAIWGAWNTSTPQLESNLRGWSSNQVFPCAEQFAGYQTASWRGVQCLTRAVCSDQNLTTGVQTCYAVIIGLTLDDASIVGNLPPEIGNMRTLSTLELTRNPSLTGTLPSTLVNTNLYNLDLHENAFYGQIPDLDIQNLQNVNLGGNRFTGSFPGLPRGGPVAYGLQNLNLSGNFLEGSILGETFENMTQLVQVDLSSNRFNGTLPTLNTMKILQVLDLSNNSFTGTLPNLTTMDSLLTMDLSGNKFTESALKSWNSSELGSLQELYLDYNLINGTLDLVYLENHGFLNDRNSYSNSSLRVLSLMNNIIENVIYSESIIESVSTIIRLNGNPYCNSPDTDDGRRCFCKQLCVLSASAVKNAKRKAVIITVVTSISSVVVLAIVLAAFSHRNRRYRRYLQLQVQQKFEEFEVKPTIFPYNQLRTATLDFHPDMKLGQGAFGAVYKGILPNGNVVAVKQLFAKTSQGIDEFLNEVVLLTGMKHRNLVNLKGCCIREQQRLLVYEYVDNHDVDKLLLAGPTKALLDWPVRLKICLGVARGLHYLHELAHPKIIHRDIKASNILLAKNFETKIADFGLASLFPDEESYIMTKHVAGTKGYLAPEYASYGQLSDKVDVYSFGVLCLEIVSGRRNINEKLPPDEIYLPNWAWELHRGARLMDLVDPTLSLQVEEKLEVQHLLAVSLLCIQMAADQRPSMGRVVAMLQGDSQSGAVVLKPGNVEQGLDSMRLFAFGESSLWTVKGEGESSVMESSFIDSSTRAAGLSEKGYSSYATSVELSDIRSVK